MLNHNDGTEARQIIVSALRKAVPRPMIETDDVPWNAEQEQLNENLTNFLGILEHIMSNTLPIPQICEMLTRANHLLHSAIKIGPEVLLCLLTMAAQAPAPEVYNIAVEMAEYTLTTRAILGYAIIETPAAGFILTMMDGPMSKQQFLLVKAFISSSMNTFAELDEKYNLIQHMAEATLASLGNLERFDQFMKCFVDLICEFDEPTSAVQIPQGCQEMIEKIFQMLIVPLFGVDNEYVFSRTTWLYKLILEADFTSPAHRFFYETDLDRRMISVFNACNNFTKQQILECFREVSSGSNTVTKLIMERNGADLAALIPAATEDMHPIIIDIAGNFIYVGADVIPIMAETGFLGLAEHVMTAGTFTGKVAAIGVFRSMVDYIGIPEVEEYFVSHEIIPLVSMFLGTNNTKTCNLELWRRCCEIIHDAAVFIQSRYTEDIFQHPMFASVDIEELYDFLIEIRYDDSVAKNEENSTAVSVENLLDIISERLEALED